METEFTKNDYESLRYACTAFFSHKWQLSVLTCLFDSPKHFGEILRQNPGISKKVLSANLRKLESKGVISRHSYTEGAVMRVEYSLTPQGEQLRGILKELTQWGAENREKITTGN
ncbi:MAG: helix-turn-helix transcriptional regulator [Erysipelotrichaceae bacterium]|nr:helix-turn-helix transcriptional regulator [Erysipelotrichaceae bacterium]MBO4538522.1 helix-turn-helix transcriptional regulator [Erysipelotrichaceae bacterium]MBR5048495.1 helix-turn-helix transcriptional regulator [Erysipelotrichaceae bacterium]